MELKKECLGKVAITIEKDYHNPNRAYDKLVIVEQEGAYKTYISRKAVPEDTPLTDREYWIPFSSLAEELQLDYNRYKSKLEIELTELKENFNSFSNTNKEIIKLIDDHINSIGKPNGIAQLDDSGKVPSEQLPSYVDDVIEFDTLNVFPQVGEEGKIYVDKDTNKTYRWSGSTYIEISNPLKPNEINGIKTIIDNYPILYHPQSSSHFSFFHGGEAVTLHVPYYDPTSKEIKVLSDYEQTIYAATTARAGIMTANDKQLLKSLPSTIITRIDFEHGENYTTSFTGYQLVDGKYVNMGTQDITPSIASTSYNGWMSKEDRKLLNSLPKVIIGQIYDQHHSEYNILTDKYELKDGIYVKTGSYDITPSNASSGYRGLMSKEDKIKLDDTTTKLTNFLSDNVEKLWVDYSEDNKASIEINYDTNENDFCLDIPYAASISSTNTGTAGLMSAQDKTKLDSINVADLDFITDAELNEILI